MCELSCIHLLSKKKKKKLYPSQINSDLDLTLVKPKKKRIHELDLIFGENFGFWVHNSQTLSLTQTIED